MAETLTLRHAAPVRWAKVVDHTRCIGCHACSTACKSENQVPVGVHRTYVKYVDVGRFPQARRAFQVTRCNQCADPPCVEACPTAAMYQRPDGIVDFDKRVCIGCKACIAACPYDAIFINPEDHSAEKCNFCAQRLDVGLEPACVVVCPTEAILVGDLNDGTSRVSETVGRDVVAVRRPEKETRPKLFYKGAHQATLDPLAAPPPAGRPLHVERAGERPPPGDLRPPGRRPTTPPRPSSPTTCRTARPGTGASASTRGRRGSPPAPTSFPPSSSSPASSLPASPLWAWAAPVVAGAFLAATGALLIADLDHPERFYMVLTRPQWRSWLVRGGVIISGYGAVLALHFLSSLLGRADVPPALLWAGVPLAVLCAVYTAWLFAQAKARDLWQSPLLPPLLLVQAVLAGASAARCRSRPRVEPGAMRRSPGSPPSPRSCTCCSSRARRRSRTRPRTRASPPAR